MPIFLHFIQHWFFVAPLCKLYMSEEAGIEPRTVATLHGDVITNEFIYCIVYTVTKIRFMCSQK
jgi:hypothetical protein